MRLRASDIRLAKSPLALDRFLLEPRTPEQVIEYAQKRLANMGYTIKRKRGPKGWKSRRMTTTLRRTIWLGVGWDGKLARDKAATLMHELVHAEQWWIHQGFLARYIASPRFRWAMEVQAYRESVRTYRAVGFTGPGLERYIQARANTIIRSYFMIGRRLRRDIRKNTAGIVRLK